jgi:hypothetical protein
MNLEKAVTVYHSVSTHSSVAPIVVADFCQWRR